MIKLDKGEACEERFKRLVYHQRASIRYERVEASNSCTRTLIFGSIFLLPFCHVFPTHFRFFDIVFYYIFSFLFGFYRPLFFPSFSLLFCTGFLLMWFQL
jgi:hypothetical protein